MIKFQYFLLKHGQKFFLSVIFIILSIIFAVHHIFDVPYRLMLADPLMIAKLNPLTGVLSNLGILLWATASIVTLFVSFHIAKEGTKNFLFLSGSLSGYLMLDDLFMMHEKILPYFLGIPEIIILISYALIVTIYFFYYYKLIISKKYYRYLFISLGCFAISVCVDIINGGYKSQYFIEDSFKFLGLAFWCIYFVRISSETLREDYEEKPR